MEKSKRSLYTAISSVILTLVNGLFGFVVTKLIIIHYGSDFNGLNATVTQFINMLLIVEGGFTLATNVALFKPLSVSKYEIVNSILSATRRIFIKIGLLFFVIGILASIIYTIIINSNLPKSIIFMTLMMTVISTVFNLIFTTKYRILIQTEQKEYIINLVNIITIFLTQILIILIILFQQHMLIVRFIIMLGSIFNGLMIGYVCRKSYNFIDFSVKPNYKLIRGTKDVFVQKFTSMVYTSVPIVYISMTAGTIYASIFAVYNSVFSILKNVIYSFVNAPRIGFGRLIAERNKNYVMKVFLQYEFIVIILISGILSTAAVLILPFIGIYTRGVEDIDYIDKYLAVILIGITFFEIIHIPSGNIINMAGKFKIGKNIQNIACISLITLMIIGNHLFSFYGILLSVLFTSIILAILEIYYIHVVYFKDGLAVFLRILIPNTIFSIILVYIEVAFLPKISGYIYFFIIGLFILLINYLLIVIINLLINRKLTVGFFKRLLKLF
ncbi:hypothetical protein P5F75_17900 [Caldifermentibacillus hisashii]|uniref:hypothetical protein n=1 Tax=Caldifermentibacillus hisashii TaxID=996558 RepID=UPI002E1E0B14|nr:hypothetical protein [Caldifermentibacillus hisashii]